MIARGSPPTVAKADDALQPPEPNEPVTVAVGPPIKPIVAVVVPAVPGYPVPPGLPAKSHKVQKSGGVVAVVVALVMQPFEELDGPKAMKAGPPLLGPHAAPQLPPLPNPG